MDRSYAHMFLMQACTERLVAN